MMNVIHKYPLTNGHNFISLPNGSKVVHFGLQGPGMCIWVEKPTNPDIVVTTHEFIIYGTGWEIPAFNEHVGTVVTSDGFVWHLYKVERFL